jgi:hypothetical protein
MPYSCGYIIMYIRVMQFAVKAEHYMYRNIHLLRKTNEEISMFMFDVGNMEV